MTDARDQERDFPDWLVPDAVMINGLPAARPHGERDVEQSGKPGPSSVPTHAPVRGVTAVKELEGGAVFDTA